MGRRRKFRWKYDEGLADLGQAKGITGRREYVSTQEASGQLEFRNPVVGAPSTESQLSSDVVIEKNSLQNVMVILMSRDGDINE